VLKSRSTAAQVRLQPSELELYGQYKAKVSLNVLKRIKDNKDGKCVTSGVGYVGSKFEP
jgi:formyltetrahydrofolate synthetase